MERNNTHTYLARDMEADVDLFVIKQHTVDSLYGVVSSLRSLVMDEAISLRASMFVCSDLARQDIAKGRKCIMESLSIRISCTLLPLHQP